MKAISNLSVFLKFAIVALLIPITITVMAGFALAGTNRLKYQYDNLYGFMLIPIMGLDQGNLARANLSAALNQLRRPGLSDQERSTLKNQAGEYEAEMNAVIVKYESDWVTTLSPEFTALLAQEGKSGLQTIESNLLAQYHQAYADFSTYREEALSGQENPAIQKDLAQLETTFTQLVDLNRQFADDSNVAAQSEIDQIRLETIIIGIVSSLVGLAVAFWISRGVTERLSKIVRVIDNMKQGNLSVRLHMENQDEIGVLASAMDEFADDLQNIVIGSMKQIADGDLNIEIHPKSSQDEIAPALIQTVDSLRGLVGEAKRLTRAAVSGQLSVRGDASTFKGGYREVIQGMNNTLDGVTRPLNMASQYVSLMAAGQIPASISEALEGDYDILKNNLNLLSEKLRDMLKDISAAANNLNTAASEILAATTQQASGASEQSAAISQTTTTVEEVKTISEQASQRALEVANASRRTVEVARNGQKAVQDTIESMALIKEKVEGISENLLALSDQTQQIGEIIATVNEIASQSNMLALNASVEAARAGEHGKGFAVVAMEVRSLAEQSRQATAQVKAILSEIQKATNTTVMATEEGTKGVEKGVQLASQAQAAIEQLSAVINESAQVATQVVAGGQQQLTGIEQIAMAMQNINQVTVQSLASTRQAEKSAQNLNDLARTMANTVGHYRY